MPSGRTLVAAAGLVGLGLWLVGSAMNQHRRSSAARWLRRHDPLLLLPIWAYFSTPGTIDCVVIYRDRRADGRTTDWREHDGYTTGALRPLWNPERRLRYGVFDACARLLHAGTGGAMVDSVEYRAILNFVLRPQAYHDADARQFMIVDPPAFHAGGGDRRGILFASPFHPLP